MTKGGWGMRWRYWVLYADWVAFVVRHKQQNHSQIGQNRRLSETKNNTIEFPLNDTHNK